METGISTIRLRGKMRNTIPEEWFGYMAALMYTIIDRDVTAMGSNVVTG
jgi:hypothetical protein